MKWLCSLTFSLFVISCGRIRDGHYELTVAATGDGHGAWFSEALSDKPVRGSLASVSAAVSCLRNEGELLLVDAGDNLVGSDAGFYYGNVACEGSYPFARMASFIGYDAVALGVGDFGSPALERYIQDMKKDGIPVLAGNVFLPSDKRYLPHYTAVRKGGLKVAVLGYTNAQVASLVDVSVAENLSFKSLLPLVQEDVDWVIAKEKPHVVVVVAHIGMGKGDGSKPSAEGMDLFRSLHGVDFLITGHDHIAKVQSTDSICVLNAGKGCQNLAGGKISLDVQHGRVVSKTVSASLQRMSTSVVDSFFVETFKPEYEELKAFMSTPIGEITDPLVSREFYWGQCDYLNFLHVLALSVQEVDISLGATLLIDGAVPAGQVAYKDIASIYPFDNKLIVLRMTGQEVKDYLEASYDAWVNEPGNAHVLRMKQTEDYKTKKLVWKLVNSPANFDSAGGLCYTVDLSKPSGSRVEISGMAGGRPFDLAKEYHVGITSYRATGSGRLLQAAGIDVPHGLAERLVCRGPEFRELLYYYLKEHHSLGPSLFSEASVVGSWFFLPDGVCDVIRREVDMLFGE